MVNLFHSAAEQLFLVSGDTPNKKYITWGPCTVNV